MRAIKKPLEINVWDITKLLKLVKDKWSDLPNEVKEAYEKGDILFLPNSIKVLTLEGWIECYSGLDYLIQGIEKEFYGIKKSIFNRTYDITYHLD